jgi:TonB family protein
MLGAWRFRLGRWLLPFALLCQERPCRAQAPAPKDAPALTRPVAKAPLHVAYPDGASGDGSVVLELLLDEHGVVSGVTVISGDEPFASAAAAAARGFQFEPARRGELALSARIRVEVFFTPPAEPTEEVPATEVPPSSDKPPASVARGVEVRKHTPLSVETMEIVVLGERAEPATTSLGRAEVRQIPGTFGDPFRAIEVMPGVAPIATGVPFFFVRGAPPGNVGYFLDGIRVPLLYHAALGPSVIHPGLIQRVDLYSGGYPARFGRFAGGIVAAETTPPKETLHGEANLRVFDAGALVEAPFGSRGQGTALVAGRYSYTAAILSLVAPEVDLTYWDYQARFYYDVTPKLRLGLFSFGAFDKFLALDSEGERQGAATQFHRIDLRAELRPSARTQAKFALTLGVDRTEAPGDDGLPDTRLEDHLLAARASLQHQLGAKAQFRTGADFSVDEYEIAAGGDVLDNERERQLLGTRKDVASGLYADLVFEPTPGVRVTPGVRADIYSSRGVTLLAIDPRISASFAASRRVTLEHTFGIARQPPSFVLPVPGFQLSDLGDGLQRSLQSSAGVVVRPGRSWQLTGTLYHNVFLNMTDALGAELARDESELTNDRDSRVDARVLGQSYGLELSAKRPLTQHLAGYFAYTLSRSTRSVGAAKALAAFDRPHVLHAAAAYDLGKRYRVGARLSAYSGMPAELEDDNQDDGGADDRPGSGDNGDDDEPAGPRGTFQRAPPFFRLDLRFEKAWPIGKDGASLALVLELLNATLSKETIEYECRPSGCTGEVIGPVTVPSIGLEAFF